MDKQIKKVATAELQREARRRRWKFLPGVLLVVAGMSQSFAAAPGWHTNEPSGLINRGCPGGSEELVRFDNFAGSIFNRDKRVGFSAESASASDRANFLAVEEALSPSVVIAQPSPYFSAFDLSPGDVPSTPNELGSVGAASEVEIETAGGADSGVCALNAGPLSEWSKPFSASLDVAQGSRRIQYGYVSTTSRDWTFGARLAF